MEIRRTKIDGLLIIEPDVFHDTRGYFLEHYNRGKYRDLGFEFEFVQDNCSSSRYGTVRGLHYQIAPHQEVKLVRCTRGATYDVIVDLRPESPTYKQWLAVELTADNHKMIYIPAGFAHGYQILEDNTEVFYQVGQFYAPKYERGARWNDPAFGIDWPIASPLILSDKDKSWPDYPM